MNYTFTHTPDPATLRRDLVADQAALVAPQSHTWETFAATCQSIAAQFRQRAQDAYDVGDQRRGDHCTARGLAWEAAARSGDLAEARP